MLPTDVQGALAAAGCALFWNGSLVMSQLMQQWQWPYFFLAGLASLIVSIGSILIMLCRGTYHLESQEVKWVFLQGLTGCLSYMLTVCAVLAGCHMGSVGALGSVNTVVAALLGHFMLGEALGKLHVLAMFLAVGGAVLIWDPESVGAVASELLGNALALLSGILSGCMYVFSRKCGNASSLMLTTMAMGQRWLVCWILAVVPAVPNGTVSTLLDVPFDSALNFSLLVLVLWFCNLLSSVGAKKCPAAMSSTVLTGVQMASGYFMDILGFDKSPNIIEVAGAYMMLAAVVTITLSRVRSKAEVTPGANLASFAEMGKLSVLSARPRAQSATVSSLPPKSLSASG